MSFIIFTKMQNSEAMDEEKPEKKNEESNLDKEDIKALLVTQST